VERCDIYLGVFGYDYGYEDQDGISPTEHEYNHAGRLKKIRLVFVWGSDETKRAPKMQKLIAKASGELIRRRVEDMCALTAEVYASLVEEEWGLKKTEPPETKILGHKYHQEFFCSICEECQTTICKLAWSRTRPGSSNPDLSFRGDDEAALEFFTA
jgi:hypothetical protein